MRKLLLLSIWALFSSSGARDLGGSAGQHRLHRNRRLQAGAAGGEAAAARATDARPHHDLHFGHRQPQFQHYSCSRKRAVNFWATEVEKAVVLKEWWHGYLDILRSSVGIQAAFPDGADILNYVGPLGPFCRRNLTVFGHGDDEKRGCFHSLRTMDELTRGPSSSSSSSSSSIVNDNPKRETGKRTDEPCVVYSIGGNNQWAFEAAIFEKTECRIETFDCTVDGVVPGGIQARTRFHKVCLGRDDGDLHGKAFLSWSSMNALANENRAPTFLKMDIEGWEHEAITNMLRPPHLTALPMYIAMEVHSFVLIQKGSERIVNNLNATQMLDFFDALYRIGGYFVVDVRTNVACPWCLEILFARVDCGSTAEIRGEGHAGSAVSSDVGPERPNAGGTESRLRAARATVAADLRSLGPQDAATEIKDMIEASVRHIKLLNSVSL